MPRSGGIFDFAAKQERLEDVEHELAEPDVWNDQERAQALSRERSSLQTVVEGLSALGSDLADAEELAEMAAEENDAGTLDEVEADLARATAILERLEFQRMFQGELDGSNAFLDVQSGSGGTEAQDWAEMLLRMYLRWGRSAVSRPS